MVNNVWWTHKEPNVDLKIAILEEELRDVQSFKWPSVQEFNIPEIAEGIAKAITDLRTGKVPPQGQY
jgi:hypothetical protein